MPDQPDPTDPSTPGAQRRALSAMCLALVS